MRYRPGAAIFLFWLIEKPRLLRRAVPWAGLAFFLGSAPFWIGTIESNFASFNIVAPPGLPNDLTRILRQSYLKMVESREYVEEAIKRNFDVGRPNTGEEIADYVTNTLMAFPAETIREYRSYVEKQ